MSSCQICLFWRRKTVKYGQCRKREPTESFKWPLTDQDDWCGKFKEIPPPYKAETLKDPYFLIARVAKVSKISADTIPGLDTRYFKEIAESVPESVLKQAVLTLADEVRLSNTENPMAKFKLIVEDLKETYQLQGAKEPGEAEL